MHSENISGDGILFSLKEVRNAEIPHTYVGTLSMLYQAAAATASYQEARPELVAQPPGNTGDLGEPLAGPSPGEPVFVADLSKEKTVGVHLVVLSQVEAESEDTS